MPYRSPEDKKAWIKRNRDKQRGYQRKHYRLHVKRTDFANMGHQQEWRRMQRAIKERSIIDSNKIEAAKKNISYRVCPMCGELKHRTEYSPSAHAKHGMCGYCRLCMNKRDVERRKLHPGTTRLQGRRQFARRRALKIGLEESFSCSDELLVRHAFHDRCFKCGAKTKLQIDHHYPLSKGYLLSVSNAVVLCQSCNSSKGDKMPNEFYCKVELERISSIINGLGPSEI